MSLHRGVPPAVPCRPAPPGHRLPGARAQPRACALGADPRALVGDPLRGRADVDGDVYFPSHADLDRLWKLAEHIISHNGGDLRFGRKHRQVLREAGFVEILATASSDSFGTPEQTAGFSRYWSEVFIGQHRPLILDQKWATEEELDAMVAALRAWGGGEDSFYARCRCEAVHAFHL
jgi:hypothetical protein